MNLNNILRKRSVTQKSTHHRNPFTWGSRIGKIIYNDRSQNSAGGSVEDDIWRGQEALSGGIDRLFLDLDVTWLHTFVKSHWTIHYTIQVCLRPQRSQNYTNACTRYSSFSWNPVHFPIVLVLLGKASVYQGSEIFSGVVLSTLLASICSVCHKLYSHGETVSLLWSGFPVAVKGTSDLIGISFTEDGGICSGSW